MAFLVYTGFYAKQQTRFCDRQACQGASEAIRRRATLDIAGAGQSRMEKEGMKRMQYLSFPLDYVFAFMPLCCNQ